MTVFCIYIIEFVTKTASILLLSCNVEVRNSFNQQWKCRRLSKTHMMLTSFKHLVVFINRTEMIYLKRPLMFSNNQIHSNTIIDSSINFPFFSVAGAGGRGLNPRPDPVESLGTFGKWHFLILVYTIVLGLVVAFQDTVGLDFLAPRNIAYQCDYFGCVHFTVIARVNVHRT